MFRNFLIVGTQRTGSTALVRSLTFHPDIACGGEWTQHVPSYRKLSFTEQVLSGDFSMLSEGQRKRIEETFSESTTWLGFKLLFRSSAMWLMHPRLAPALWLDRFDAYRRWIAERPALHVIHIKRQDKIEWLKSKYLADATRSYTAKAYPDDMKVEIPIDDAVKRLLAKDWIDTCLEALGESNPYLQVTYEDFLKSDAQIVARLMSFLGCDVGRLKDFDYRKQKRQSSRPASDYIANYERLVAVLGSRLPQ